MASTGLALVLAGVTTAPSGAVSAPQRMLAGPEDQSQPSVNDTYLIWTQNSVAHSNRYHAFGKVLGTTDAFRLNPTGTRGFAGGIDPDQDRAIYQQIDGPSSDLYTISLATRRAHQAPRSGQQLPMGVGTADLERLLSCSPATCSPEAPRQRPRCISTTGRRRRSRCSRAANSSSSTCRRRPWGSTSPAGPSAVP